MSQKLFTHNNKKHENVNWVWMTRISISNSQLQERKKTLPSTITEFSPTREERSIVLHRWKVSSTPSSFLPEIQTSQNKVELSLSKSSHQDKKTTLRKQIINALCIYIAHLALVYWRIVCSQFQILYQIKIGELIIIIIIIIIASNFFLHFMFHGTEIFIWWKPITF